MQTMFGGLLTILENLIVEEVWISKQGKNSENYEKFLQIVKQKNIKVKILKAGDKNEIDDIKFEVLWPEKEQISENILNNNSLVIKMNYKKISILFTGDIEAIAEKEIIKKYGNKLKSTILKVAHHGSKGSSIEEFIQLVKPKIAIIGVGANNTFGHPGEIVLQRLKESNCKIYRTDINGEIIIKINKNSEVSVDKMIK